MGRKKLEWYPGAIYHVTARGMEEASKNTEHK